MRPDLVKAVRGTLERGVDDETASAVLEFVVGDAFTDAGRELVQAFGQRDVAYYRTAFLEHGLLDAMTASATIAEAFLVVGNAEAGAVELLRFLQALALDLAERSRAVARRDTLELDRQVADATRRCRWRGGRRGR